MDTSIHFTEVLGLLAVLAGIGAWIGVLLHLVQRRHAHRRARILVHQFHRT